MRPILSAFFLAFVTSGYSQSGFTLDNYKGTIYALEEADVEAGYNKYVLEAEILGSIEWKEINIPDRKTDVPFSNIEFTTLFGIIFKSQIHVDESACFEFYLGSDDGSILWINEEEVIDNDGVHKMILKRNQKILSKGSHDIKIWYYQAYRTRYGLTFNVNKLGEKCPDLTPEIDPFAPKLLNLSSSVLFDLDAYEIKVEAYQELDSIVDIINKSNPYVVKVIGHTDDQGDNKYNYSLSQKRAKVIKNYLMKDQINSSVKYISRGLGENKPIGDNTTPEGRMANRRVEIIIETKQ